MQLYHVTVIVLPIQLGVLENINLKQKQVTLEHVSMEHYISRVSLIPYKI
jgi:hypothetical protein